MDTDSFVITIKTEYFYKGIANDIRKWFDTSNYDEDDKKSLPIGNVWKWLTYVWKLYRLLV